ncbi:hypothetical protein BV22DRAFT_1133427 [Leucogyrophana mollusca]|uniref:Uncharacterized protein n=1 Tax=Leucogyrophana mollusca TaxID=85980 RepID=A0ACB8B5I5_9AGAM|nr:hypothetical protein BV22DRAFT_1133427 [Leucogyrophana mollusca]
MATIESTAQSLYYDNCFSVATATILVYDYFLTVGQEVEYVWQRPMSLMSFLYYVVRYLGLFVGIVEALWGNIIRGSVSMYVFYSCCSTRFDGRGFDIGGGFYIFVNVGCYVIIWTSAAIMVLRIFAMYRQSKTILGVLLLFFVPTVAASIGFIVKFTNISIVKSVVMEIDFLGTNYCTEAFMTEAQLLLIMYLSIPRLCLDVLLVVLAVGRLVKDTADNRVLGKWQPNVYLRMLARDSIVYFLLNLAFTMMTFIEPFTTYPTWYQYANECISNTVPYMLAPHLIISFRYHTKADAIHSGFASHLGTSLGAGEQEMCFARPALTSSMDERGV